MCIIPCLERYVVLTTDKVVTEWCQGKQSAGHPAARLVGPNYSTARIYET